MAGVEVSSRHSAEDAARLSGWVEPSCPH